MENKQLNKKQKERVIDNLITLHYNAWMYPSEILKKDFIEWVKRKVFDNGLSCIDHFDSEKDFFENFEFSDLMDERGFSVMYLLYEFDKGKISFEELKDYFKGFEYRTSCFGDYIKEVQRDFDIKINQEDKKHG